METDDLSQKLVTEVLECLSELNAGAYTNHGFETSGALTSYLKDTPARDESERNEEVALLANAVTSFD